MKVLIVEDETAASENLAVMLNDLDPSIEIVGCAESIQQTLRLLRSSTQPDLIFMDIELSDGNSFALFDQIQVDTPIIFTTAFDQFAIDAFKVNSIDYLLKPIKVSDLRRALEKFSRLSLKGRETYLEMLRKLSPASPSSPRSRMLLSYKEDHIPVDVQDIAFFYTSDRSTTVYLRNGQKVPCNLTLEQAMGQLDTGMFIRANKQFIVSRSSIVRISVRFDSRVLVQTDVQSPEVIYVSKNKAAEFKAWLAR